MVATRHSLPNDADGEAQPTNKRVSRVLRQLQIDGTDALKGDSLPHDDQAELATYHYRGAVYGVTADTPREWIDRQPDRYKARQQAALALSPQKSLPVHTTISRKRKRDASESSPIDFTASAPKQARQDVPHSEELVRVPSKRQGVRVQGRKGAKRSASKNMSIPDSAAAAAARSVSILKDCEETLARWIAYWARQDERGVEVELGFADDIAFVLLVKMTAHWNEQLERVSTGYCRLRERGFYDALQRLRKRRQAARLAGRYGGRCDEMGELDVLQHHTKEERVSQEGQEDWESPQRPEEETSEEGYRGVQTVATHAQHPDTSLYNTDQSRPYFHTSPPPPPSSQSPTSAVLTTPASKCSRRRDSAASIEDNEPTASAQLRHEAAQQEYHNTHEDMHYLASPIPLHVSCESNTTPVYTPNELHDPSVLATTKERLKLVHPKRDVHRGRLKGESHAARRRRVRRELSILRCWPVTAADAPQPSSVLH